MRVRTCAGVVELEVWYGYDAKRRRCACPIRELWGLTAHQQSSPTLEDKLAFTLTATGSYEQAAALATKWGCPAYDSTLHALAQRLGQRAEQQTQARLKTLPREREPQRAATPLAVFMIDGWQARHRGAGWGRKRTQAPRVEWHELKTAVSYRHEQAARSDRGRGQLTEKVVVHWQGEALELGRRLHWEAMREGLGRAQAMLAVGDGAPWIWNLVADRWRGATEVLDFYHASQHVWELGRALQRNDEVKTKTWVEQQLHRLRYGKDRAVLREIRALTPPRGEAGKVVRREQNYLAEHAERTRYAAVAARGWPIGSGAVESACGQKQSRFKRPGQFWTAHGLRNLSALEEARYNDHWDELWTTP
jgi:hypothetical protein